MLLSNRFTLPENRIPTKQSQAQFAEKFSKSQNWESLPENRGADLRPHPYFRVFFLTFVIY
jgi:hypothetical protein